MSEPVVIDLTADKLIGCEALFPPEIENDRWVLYHGTSSVAEQQIDAEGLIWKPATYSKADIDQLISIFESMGWVGTNAAGMAVLKPFTQAGDFGSEDKKPIYFYDDGLAAAPFYATRDCAGGETARAVRYAMADLDLFLEDEGVRNRRPVDLEWLRDSIASLSDLRKRCFATQDAYDYGIVYAVKFVPEDLESLTYHNAMGIRCFRDLAADRIVGKARLHAEDDVINRADERLDMFSRFMERADDPNGLLCRLDGVRGSDPSA